MRENQEKSLPITYEQIQVETFLTDENVLLLKKMFKDKDAYSYYIRSLWILRNLTRRLCETTTPMGVIYDEQHEMFPVLKMTNELIGALCRENAYVMHVGDAVNCVIDNEVYNIYRIG